MSKTLHSGLLQLDILDYLFEKHLRTFSSHEFPLKFGKLDDPKLIANIKRLINDKLITAESVRIIGGHERIVVSELKLTTYGFHFVAHNPPVNKF